jgi:DNA-binding MarR family transcriptional regulator
LDALKRRFAATYGQRSRFQFEVMEALFTFRTTAQQVENTLYDWLEGTSLSPARYQILMVLWALDGGPVPYQDIIAALRVKRATVSGLMSALERDGLVVSSVDVHDKRKLLARLTKSGSAVVTGALDINTKRIETAFGNLSKAELETLTRLLLQVRQGFEPERSHASQE